MDEIFPSYFSEYSSEIYWELFIIMNEYFSRSKTYLFIIFWPIYILYTTVSSGNSNFLLSVFYFPPDF